MAAMGTGTATNNSTGKSGADWIAPDCQGQNFYHLDPAFQSILADYMADDLHAHLEPHLERLGGLAGGRLDELARLADEHKPVLHRRDRYGRDEDWIEYHPAYKEMERIAFDDFGLHRMSHTGGVLGWPKPMGPLVKYAIQYLFVQAEFGLMCPISVSDTSAFLINRYAAPEIRDRYVPRMTAPTRDEMWTGAQFMTEQVGGSDVSNLEVEARFDGQDWRIYGDKWFCSHTDGDVIMMLARPEGAGPGNHGLSLFVVPRTLEDGTRNDYTIVRLKRKLGTLSMASGEVRFDGAVAYLLGEEGRGLKHMMDQVNLSRLSHGVRAAAMMRRCLNETMAVARGRVVFGETLINHPLMRRQIMKLMVPTEQALSVFLFAAKMMEQADAGGEGAARVLRIVTPLLKMRSNRDNVTVATAAMEARGGNGYIEDWVNARLVRDAHIGVLWEGTSSINALDVTRRAIGKAEAHKALGAALNDIVEAADGIPGQFRGELSALIDQAVRFAEEVAARPENEPYSRQASNALYHVMSAVLMAREGAMMAGSAGDARRLLVARLVIDHRMRARDPMAIEDVFAESECADLLLNDDPPSLDRASKALAA